VIFSAGATLESDGCFSDETLFGSITRHLDEVKSAIDKFPVIEAAKVISLVIEIVRDGGTVWVAGNGGSAASANHLANDCASAARTMFTGPVKFISLADSVARITALANDIDYSQVFAEQLRTAAGPADLLLVLSVSGTSPNVVCAAVAARELGVRVAALVGQRGALAATCDAVLDLRVSDYGVAEDLHLMFNHMLVRALRGDRAVMLAEPDRPEQLPAIDSGLH
jgi:D-sedoheptulose 7-phosphate isomerase